MKKKIVVALGGNALGNSPKEQLELVKSTSKVIVDLVEDGFNVIVTHGNGPQVGMINLAMESASESVNTPEVPFAECGAMSQGYIGYHFQQAIQTEIAKRSMRRKCVSIITQVLVDSNDTAFSNPTKPIGSFYTEEEAKEFEKTKGYVFKEDAGRGYRRVVPSPKPVKILESSIIKDLSNKGDIVIAAGGGGIPVVKKRNQVVGVDAVIDKDRTSSKLAIDLKADIFLILTAVDMVYLDYGKPTQKGIDILSIKEAEEYMKNNEFKEGSMLPKIEACIDFVKGNRNGQAIITSLKKASIALTGKTGTIIVRKK